MDQQARRQEFADVPAQPDQCSVRETGCLIQPAFRIYCRTEGTTLQACQPCYNGWQDKAHRFGLADRCPVCAGMPVVKIKATPHADAPPVPLTGPAAKAIEDAMHREGITVDVRERVLARLNRDASWLGYSYPGAGSHPAGFKGSS